MPLTWDMRTGDARKVLADVPTGSVQCIVTCPPGHRAVDPGVCACVGQKGSCVSCDGHGRLPFSDDLIGLEPTVEQYLANLGDALDEGHRILADSGLLWIEVRDVIAKKDEAPGTRPPPTQHFERADRFGDRSADPLTIPGMSLDIPGRVYGMLVRRGWYPLWRVTVWTSNYRPSPYKDRPKRSTHTVWMVAKSKKFYFDQQAVIEETVSDEGAGNKETQYGDHTERAPNAGTSVVWPYRDHRPIRDWWPVVGERDTFIKAPVTNPTVAENCIRLSTRPGDTVVDLFAGSGRVGDVAIQQARSFLGVELVPRCADYARRRFREANPWWKMTRAFIPKYQPPIVRDVPISLDKRRNRPGSGS